MDYTKPLPVVDVWSRPFWEACKAHKLIAQKCTQSGEVFFPPAPVSPVTRSNEWTWVELSGRGRIWSWVVMHQLYFKSFADEIPYVIAQVKLDEGPFLVTNLVDVSRDELKIDLPVRVVFADATDTITLPKFTLIR